MNPILLPLNSEQVTVVLDALVAFSSREGARHDAYSKGLADTADEVANNVRCLQHIDTESTRQVLLSLGLGVGRGRPQG